LWKIVKLGSFFLKKKIKIDSKIIQKMSIFFNFKSEFKIKKQNCYPQIFQIPWENKRSTFFFTIQTRNSEKIFDMKRNKIGHLPSEFDISD